MFCDQGAVIFVCVRGVCISWLFRERESKNEVVEREFTDWEIEAWVFVSFCFVQSKKQSWLLSQRFSSIRWKTNQETVPLGHQDSKVSPMEVFKNRVKFFSEKWLLSRITCRKYWKLHVLNLQTCIVLILINISKHCALLSAMTMSEIMRSVTGNRD